MLSPVHIAEVAHEANRAYTETVMGIWSVKPWASVKQGDRDTFVTVVKGVTAETSPVEFFDQLASSWNVTGTSEFANLGHERKLQIRLVLAVVKTLLGF